MQTLGEQLQSQRTNREQALRLLHKLAEEAQQQEAELAEEPLTAVAPLRRRDAAGQLSLQRSSDDSAGSAGDLAEETFTEDRKELEEEQGGASSEPPDPGESRVPADRESLREAENAIRDLIRELAPVQESGLAEAADSGSAGPGFSQESDKEGGERPGEDGDLVPEGSGSAQDEPVEQGSPGSAAVVDRLGERAFPPPPTRGAESRLPGTIGEGGSITAMIRALPQGGSGELSDVGIPPEALAEYEKQIEHTIRKEDIPPNLRETVRSYFINLGLWEAANE
jgi:hypothetical protein